MTVSAPGSFAGIIMQARISGTNNIVGTWSTPPNGYKLMQCQNSGDTITHSNIQPKTTQIFTWSAPTTDVGNVEFRYLLCKID